MPRRQIPHRPPRGTHYTPETLIPALGAATFADELVGYDDISPIRAWTHFGGLRPQQIPLDLNAWMSRADWRLLATAAGWICIEQRTNIDAMYVSSVTLYPPYTAIEDAWATCVRFMQERPFEVDLRRAVVFNRPPRSHTFIAVYIDRAERVSFTPGEGLTLLGYAEHESLEGLSPGEARLRFEDGSDIVVRGDRSFRVIRTGTDFRRRRSENTRQVASSYGNPEASRTRVAPVPASPDTLSDALRRDSEPVRDQSSLGSAAGMSLAGIEHLRALQRRGELRWQPDFAWLDESNPLDPLDVAERSGIAEERNAELRASVMSGGLRGSVTGRLLHRDTISRLFEPET